METILSAGIDIGTSTTQLIFSRLVLENTGGFGKIPQIEVTSREIIYRSEIYFTPLSSEDEIDGPRVAELIKKEYARAGIRPSDLTTGAVIITGESSRKRNAEEVTSAISEIAGDFVVAAAGADLESVLAGKGSGAAGISREKGQIVANFDIGGGTTNICIFKDGEVLDCACLDIGGRLIRVMDGKIVYIAPKWEKVIQALKLPVRCGMSADSRILKKLTDFMADVMAQTLEVSPAAPAVPGIQLPDYLADGHLLKNGERAEAVVFSGGVAACMSGMDAAGDTASDTTSEEVFRYGDIGPLLALSVRENRRFAGMKVFPAGETMRATVIGAGNYSMNVSGSTIEYTAESFPIKNIPVMRVILNTAEDIPVLGDRIQQAFSMYQNEDTEDAPPVLTALAMNGLRCPDFAQVQEIAHIIFENCFTGETSDPLIILFEQDIGKAVGQALRRLVRGRRPLICIDQISCDDGDYIDLGEPAAGGTVIPVVVKTLIFHENTSRGTS